MKPSKLALSLFIGSALVAPIIHAQSSLSDKDASVAAYNWTGFYAGLNIGSLRHTMNVTDNQASSFLATIQQVSTPEISGGFQMGFRRQLLMSQASGVYGLEFSADASNAKFLMQYGSPFALYQLNSENKLKSVWMLQAMGGIAADRTLLFVALGLAEANITGSITNADGIPFFDYFSVSQKAWGPAISAGIEYAFSNKISARVKVDVMTPNVYTVRNNVNDRFQISNNIVQGTLGVNYKFG